jgi:hypothetical protein
MLTYPLNDLISVLTIATKKGDDMKTFYQITFTNGESIEFASYDVAKGYADMFNLAEPTAVACV